MLEIEPRLPGLPIGAVENESIVLGERSEQRGRCWAMAQIQMGQQETMAASSTRPAIHGENLNNLLLGVMSGTEQRREASTPVRRLARPGQGVKIMLGDVICDGVGQPFRRDSRDAPKLVGEYPRPEGRVRKNSLAPSHSASVPRDSQYAHLSSLSSSPDGSLPAAAGEQHPHLGLSAAARPVCRSP